MILNVHNVMVHRLTVYRVNQHISIMIMDVMKYVLISSMPKVLQMELEYALLVSIYAKHVPVRQFVKAAIPTSYSMELV